MRWKFNLVLIAILLVITSMSFAGGDDPWPLEPAPIDDADTSTPWIPEKHSKIQFKIDKYRLNTGYVFLKITALRSKDNRAVAFGSAIIEAKQSEVLLSMRNYNGKKYPVRLVSYFADLKTIGLGISIYRDYCMEEKQSFVLRKAGASQNTFEEDFFSL